MHIASASRADYVWLFKDADPADGESQVNAPAQWRPLRRSDQASLERAAAEGRDVAPVNGGRFEVRIVERLLVDCYDALPPCEPRPVRRALWFRLNGSVWEPYDENDSELIEKGCQGLQQIAKEKGEPAADADSIVQVVQLHSEGGGCQVRLKLVATQSDSSWSSYLPSGMTAKAKSDAKGPYHWALEAEEELPSTSWLSMTKRRSVKRGFGEVQVEEGEEEDEVLSNRPSQCLYLMVHGIGEKMWSEHGTGHEAQVARFRQNIHRCQLLSGGFSRSDEGWKWSPASPEAREDRPNVPKGEVIRLSWWQTVHTGELDAQLERITLPRIPQARQIANYAIAEAIFYTQLKHRETIIKGVAASLEAGYRRYKQHHPEFCGQVVLVGHSLGGVILFELLRHGAARYGPEARLSFVPAALFTLGSPIGIFLHCSGDVPEVGYALPGGTRMFNVFHPLDPVAYRLEPLLAADLQNVPPEEVPYQTVPSGGQEKASGSIASLWSWAVGKSKMDDKMRQLLATVGLNAGERIDWVLQEDYSLIKTPEIMHALPSHSSYFGSASVASFIHAQTLRLIGANVSQIEFSSQNVETASSPVLRNDDSSYGTSTGVEAAASPEEGDEESSSCGPITLTLSMLSEVENEAQAAADLPGEHVEVSESCSSLSAIAAIGGGDAPPEPKRRSRVHRNSTTPTFEYRHSAGKANCPSGDSQPPGGPMLAEDFPDLQGT